MKLFTMIHTEGRKAFILSSPANIASTRRGIDYEKPIQCEKIMHEGRKWWQWNDVRNLSLWRKETEAKAIQRVYQTWRRRNDMIYDEEKEEMTPSIFSDAMWSQYWYIALMPYQLLMIIFYSLFMKRGRGAADPRPLPRRASFSAVPPAGGVLTSNRWERCLTMTYPAWWRPYREEIAI